jgi:indole-3-acetate monooxygenase
MANGTSEHSATIPERHLSAADILANARALRPYLAANAAAIDEARRLPTEVAARLKEAGMFRLMMPKARGGPALSTFEQVEVIEELSRGNTSAAWCVMIGCDSGYYAGFLEEAAARELYPRLDMATAGLVYPIGRADRVEGGYRVSGQWAFGSGITHAEVISAGCFVYENGTPVMSGNPPRREWRMMLAPASSYTIEDTWHTTGLRGTGSNDYRTDNLFVPHEHSFSFLEPARCSETLWRSNNTFFGKGAGVSLGAARTMIDAFVETMQTKVEVPSRRPYKDFARIQTVVADAEMILGAARAYVFSAYERQWRKLERDEPLTERERADFLLALVNAGNSAREVIRMLFDAIGASAIYANRGPFDRLLRDAETWCQHIGVQRKMLEPIGGLLLKSDHAPPFAFL